MKRIIKEAFLLVGMLLINTTTCFSEVIVGENVEKINFSMPAHFMKLLLLFALLFWIIFVYKIKKMKRLNWIVIFFLLLFALGASYFATINACLLCTILSIVDVILTLVLYILYIKKHDEDDYEEDFSDYPYGKDPYDDHDGWRRH